MFRNMKVLSRYILNQAEYILHSHDRRRLPQHQAWRLEWAEERSVSPGGCGLLRVRRLSQGRYLILDTRYLQAITPRHPGVSSWLCPAAGRGRWCGKMVTAGLLQRSSCILRPDARVLRPARHGDPGVPARHPHLHQPRGPQLLQTRAEDVLHRAGVPAAVLQQGQQCLNGHSLECLKYQNASSRRPE